MIPALSCSSLDIGISSFEGWACFPRFSMLASLSGRCITQMGYLWYLFGELGRNPYTRTSENTCSTRFGA